MFAFVYHAIDEAAAKADCFAIATRRTAHGARFAVCPNGADLPCADLVVTWDDVEYVVALEHSGPIGGWRLPRSAHGLAIMTDILAHEFAA